jgi:hypothetical protein
MRAEVPDKCFAFSGMREAKASLTDRAMLVGLRVLLRFL